MAYSYGYNEQKKDEYLAEVIGFLPPPLGEGQERKVIVKCTEHGDTKTVGMSDISEIEDRAR